jgi:hypothetical protein
MPYCGEMLATVLQTSHTAGSVHWETFKCLNSIPQLCRHFFFFFREKGGLVWLTLLEVSVFDQLVLQAFLCFILNGKGKTKECISHSRVYKSRHNVS